MPWAAWAKINDKGLAQYVLPQIANRVRLSITRDDALTKPGGRRDVTEAIFNALCTFDIRYARPLYNPIQEQQTIRAPETILDGSGDGTCLDLALLFAGVALGNELLPLVVVLDGHAVVAVSMEFGRRDADHLRRPTDDGEWASTGILSHVTTLRALTDQNRYLIVECTGFAKRDAIPADVPEGQGRVDGHLSFARAIKAGREQLERADRPLQFAVDVAYLQDVGKQSTLDPVGRSLERVKPQLKRRLARIFETHQLFGGRSEELARLDAFLAGPSGYMVITGGSGCGKTSLIANWIRQLETRSTHVAYHFISLQHDTAGHDETLLSLVQQLSYWNSLPTLATSGAEVESSFIELITESTAPVVVVIDALDEAKGWQVGRQLFPARLAPNIHVVLSARVVAGKDWITHLDLQRPEHIELGPLSQAEVEEVLRAAKVPAWVFDKNALTLLTDKIAGDPFYLRVLVEDLLRGDIATPLALAKQPRGINEYLRQWWDEIRPTASAQAVQDLLGYLLVARGPISASELKEVSPDDALSGFSFDAALENIRRFVVGDTNRGFSLSHWRFQDYLTQEVLTDADQRPYRNRLEDWCDQWRTNKGPYALSYAVARRLDVLAAAPQSKRYDEIGKVVTLICDEEYQQRRVEATDALASLKLDVPRVIQEIARSADVSVIPQLARVAMEHEHIEHTWLLPESMLAPASQGYVEEAERRLALFQAEDHWRDAARLLIAWLAAPYDAGAARRALRASGEKWTDVPPLPMLRDRVLATIGAGDPPILTLPYYPNVLPEPRSEGEMQQIVAELGADQSATMRISGVEPVRVPGRQSLRARGTGKETPTYIAEGDAPHLVAFAIPATNREAGTKLIRQYIGIHAANPYADYRNRSLWGILGAVLCHPETDWARDTTKLLVTGAFAPSPIRFRESFRIAVLCRLDQAGVADGRAQFDRIVSETRAGAARIRETRWESDSWGNYSRRFSALAEAAAVALKDRSLAEAFLNEAAMLPVGFAGYQAPTSLTLAEANKIIRPNDTVSRSAALTQARNSAHNVQDPGFCARTTARVNAMREVWWAQPLENLTGILDEFIRDPFERRFAPIHRIAEDFEARPKTEERIALDELRNARTLTDLAQNVFHLPVSAFERLNPGVPQEIAAVDQIAVPDPKFAPLLAARFSAELVSRTDLSDDDRVSYLARLVPIALPNATTLDVVLARLTLAMTTAAPLMLSELLAVAPALEDYPK